MIMGHAGAVAAVQRSKAYIVALRLEVLCSRGRRSTFAADPTDKEVERKAVRRRDPRVSNHLFAVGGRHDHEAVDEPGGRAPDLDGTHTHVHLALESWSKAGRQLRQTVYICAAA